MRFFLLLITISVSFQISAQTSLNMNLLYQWKDTSLTQSIIGSTYNEVWGYSNNGREYAIIGSTAGTHIFDITDINNVDTVEFIPGKLQGSDIIHRDFDTYQDYLYIVCDEGPSSLQIADLSFLPDSVPLVYDYDILINTSHNIFIDTVSGHLYSCGGATNLGANFLSIYSLVADPTNPQFIINCSNDVPFWNTTIGYLHDIYVKNDTAYCHAGTNGFFIVDFTDMQNVQGLGSLTSYVQQGYNHSGWLHRSGNFYAFADETAGMDVKIIDVTDFSNLLLVDTIGSNQNQNLSKPHNVIFYGDLLFVSFYEDGLYVFDSSDPYNISILGYYDTTTLPYVFAAGNWGVYPFLPSGKILASDEQEGLLVFDTSFPVNVQSNISSNKLEFMLYPNPTKNELNIITTKFDNFKKYTITDIYGRTVKKGEIVSSQTKIDIDGLNIGIYIFSIYKKGSEKITNKFVKN